MPELPEVETIVRDLRLMVTQKTIESVRVLRPNVVKGAEDIFKSTLIGKSFNSISRRGKNIVLHMSHEYVLVINLGMTGRLALDTDDSVLTHPAVQFQLDRGKSLVYDDIRRFGTLRLFKEIDWTNQSERLGPEPLSPNYKWTDLHENLASSRSPIRSWLLNQKNLAGVGNIYANEALHLAGVHPQRPSNRLAKPESKLLHQSLISILNNAIENRGTTLRNYRDATGLQGNNKPNLKIYGRHEQACFGCKSLVERIVFSNRSAFFCPSCQS